MTSFAPLSPEFEPLFRVECEVGAIETLGPMAMGERRVVAITGGRIVAEWDIPRDCIFFAANGHHTLPFCVIQEAVLQPCGWLSVFMGVPLSTDRELCFRNLDGTLELFEECTIQGGTLRTVVENTSISSLNGTTILAFQVEAFLDDRPLLKMKTVFGYFGVEAMAQQAGLATEDEERKQLSESSAATFELTTRPAQFFGQPLRMADEELRLLDRISGYWPNGGAGIKGRDLVRLLSAGGEHHDRQLRPGPDRAP